MEAQEQIERFKQFIEEFYLDALLESVRQGNEFFIVDFGLLSSFDIDLAQEILEQPEETLKAAEIAARDFDLPKELGHLHVRLTNVTEAQNTLIRNIRSEHIGKFIVVEGTVRQKSDVRPQVTSARFECPSCGNIINVLQLEEKFREPTRCGCGRKGKFRLLTKELMDVQGIVLEESTKNLEGGEQPKRINIFLSHDLVSPLSEKSTNPGSSIRVVGTVKEIPKILRTGGQSTKYDLLLEANNFDPMEEDFSNIEITEEEEKAILELSNDPDISKKLAQSLAPGIYGHDKVKEALVMQFMGGSAKTRDDGVRTRGDIHILLIGDPGAGKSAMLKRSAVVAPKARYVSGKGVSGAGLTAAVVRDEFLHGWALEAGALVLGNRGIVMIDEMDKMTTEDRSAMHEALEQQTVSISKANIQATLRCETTVLAAANPKLGRFDPYESLAKQIDLPPALINRFDLIFTIKDMPDPDRDSQMAGFILSLHKKGSEESEIPTDLLRKYLVYGRQRLNPILSEQAIQELQDYYVQMRGTAQTEEGALRSIPITARQLEALVRLAEAAARVRLSNKVLKKDARKAIDLLHYCLEQVGLDKETGKIDIDRIATGMSTSERGKIVTVREVVNELEEKLGKQIPVDDIIATCEERGISKSQAEESIEKLKRQGDIFEPKRGFISKI